MYSMLSYFIGATRRSRDSVPSRSDYGSRLDTSALPTEISGQGQGAGVRETAIAFVNCRSSVPVSLGMGAQYAGVVTTEHGVSDGQPSNVGSGRREGQGACAETTAICVVDSRSSDLVSGGMDAHCPGAATTTGIDDDCPSDHGSRRMDAQAVGKTTTTEVVFDD